MRISDCEFEDGPRSSQEFGVPALIQQSAIRDSKFELHYAA